MNKHHVQQVGPRRHASHKEITPTPLPHEVLDLITKDVIEIIVDTEYQGAKTLSIQACLTLPGGRVAVQVYHAQTIPEPSIEEVCSTLQTSGVLGELDAVELLFRSPKPIHARLTPGQMVADLLACETLKPLTGNAVSRQTEFEPSNDPNPSNRAITVRVVSHFLQADLARIFGAAFWHEVLFDNSESRRDRMPMVCLTESKRLRLTNPNARAFALPPIVEFVLYAGELIPLRLETWDTRLPFGGGSLDELCTAFLGRSKLKLPDDFDKSNMQREFQRRPVDAWSYAIGDALQTLRLLDAMRHQDRAIHESVGRRSEMIPKMKATVGARVSEFLDLAVQEKLEGSAVLKTRSAKRALMRKAGITYLAAHGRSRFGHQTTDVHGGLMFSRSSKTLWHHASGALRDVDLSACYPSCLQTIDIYCGRPVIFEPGAILLTVAEAVSTMGQHAAGDDAWFLKVSGRISAMPNVLIPSTSDALTSENLRRRSGRVSSDDRKGATLYSTVVESGIITADTWLAIQLLPADAQRDYMNLRVETIVFYPRALVADDAKSFDALHAEVFNDGLPWTAVPDLKHLRILQCDRLDQDYVSYRFPMSELTSQLLALRKKAQADHGKESGADRAMKVQINSLYGVLGSKHYFTSNLVAANVITARARAQAFALTMVLNGLQTITDGVSYRADRIPACNFAECFLRKPDYPLDHADDLSLIPFLSARVPQNDREFCEWFPQHAARFFGVDANDFARLFFVNVEHKVTDKQTGRISFDALACDGSSNHVKFVEGMGGFIAIDAKMRSYGRESKLVLTPAVLNTYSNDQLTDLLPVTSDRKLLKLAESLKKTVDAVNDCGRAMLPLGLPFEQVKAYRIIKLSAFVFCDPQQRRAILRQVEKFEQEFGALDVLALRRGHSCRATGSLMALLQDIYDYIQSGGRDLPKKLNMRASRITSAQQHAIDARRQGREAACRRNSRRLLDAIGIDRQGAPLVGILCCTDNTNSLRAMQNASP